MSRNINTKVNIHNSDELEKFYMDEEKKLDARNDKRERNQKFKAQKAKSQSGSFVRINNTPEVSKIWCKLFKENPFAIDVYYVLINKANVYGTTFIEPDGILSVMNTSHNKKDYVPGYRINIKSIETALETLIKFDFIKEGCVDGERCSFLNSKYVLIRSLNNLKVCGYFPEEFIIEESYKPYTWFAIDTHKNVLEKNMAIMRKSKETFAFHLVISHFMDLGNKITEKLNTLSKMVGKAVRTLFDYFKFLFDNKLILKKRAKKGAARVNSYGLNSIFTFKKNFAKDTMQAYEEDIYDLSGVTGSNKTAYNIKKGKTVSLRTQEDINKYVIETGYMLHKEAIRKAKRDAYYGNTAKVSLDKTTNSKDNTIKANILVEDAPLVPSFSFDDEMEFGEISMEEAMLIPSLCF